MQHSTTPSGFKMFNYGVIGFLIAFLGLVLLYYLIV